MRSKEWFSKRKKSKKNQCSQEVTKTAEEGLDGTKKRRKKKEIITSEERTVDAGESKSRTPPTTPEKNKNDKTYLKCFFS